MGEWGPEKSSMPVHPSRGKGQAGARHIRPGIKRRNPRDSGGSETQKLKKERVKEGTDRRSNHLRHRGRKAPKKKKRRRKKEKKL